MAGAGKKTFVAGEVLTAAQVNDYLMDQAVMRFSGSAARAASITAPTEGMVTYLDSTNRLYIYDGATWQEMPTDQDDVRNLITGSAQVLVGAASGSLIAVGGAVNGRVLTAASAAPGGVEWALPSGAGDAVYLRVTATGVTALPTAIDGGFYRIALSNATSYTDVEWRFVDTSGNLYGATITSGTGFFTIPTTVASLNLTTGTFPFNVLIEEVKGVSDTLPNAPTVSNFTFTTLYSGSFTATTSPTAASIGQFNLATGQFNVLGPASVRTGASVLTDAGGTGGASYDVAIVESSPTGLWSRSTPSKSRAYPYYIFTANGTYVPPPGSASAEILVVAGGGGGGSSNDSSRQGGGGGAGGASLFTNVATPGSVAITVGAGGAAGTSGNPSSFGPTRSTTGGGGGGSFGSPVNASTGGSGGGGATPGGTGAAGTPGQGFGGSNAIAGPNSAGGGGGHSASAGAASSPTGGAGGAGTTWFGRAFAGGGGGGGNPTGGAGGLGGGGNGGNGFPNPGAAGRATSGGGGGGSGGLPAGAPPSGGTGGSGIVIVRPL